MGVKVSLGGYDSPLESATPSAITTTPSSGFMQFISAQFGYVATYVEGFFGTSASRVFYIVSDSLDSLHDEDPNAALEDLTRLYQSFVSSLPKLKEICVRNSDLVSFLLEQLQ